MEKCISSSYGPAILLARYYQPWGSAGPDKDTRAFQIFVENPYFYLMEDEQYTQVNDTGKITRVKLTKKDTHPTLICTIKQSLTGIVYLHLNQDNITEDILERLINGMRFLKEKANNNIDWTCFMVEELNQALQKIN